MRQSLIVAQRVGTIADAPIIVLDKVKSLVVAVMEELMESNDIYREIAN